MSDQDLVNHAIDADDAVIDAKIQDINDLNELIPAFIDRKKVNAANRLAINSAPQDYLAEHAVRLAELQRLDTARFQAQLPPTVSFNVGEVTSQISSASTSSYVSFVTGAFATDPTEFLPWTDAPMRAFTALAEEREKQSTLPKSLGKLDPQVALVYQAALDCYKKALAGTIGVDDANNRMRSTIQTLWGQLVLRAQNRRQGKLGRGNHFELKKSSHRELITECLAGPSSKTLLNVSLDQLYALYQDFSTPAKRPLDRDIQALERRYLGWTFQLDAIVKLIDW